MPLIEKLFLYSVYKVRIFERTSLVGPFWVAICLLVSAMNDVERLRIWV